MTELDRTLAIDLYRRMQIVRHFEARAGQLYHDGALPGFVHLSIGQEACAVGACAALRADDVITSTHRGHGHCLAKGADPRRMMAELFAKTDGYSRGRGGSMHIADVGVGVLGANGIVGQSGPLALGAALTAQVRGLDRVALAFFGEGASGAGPTMEAMNIASIWRMPVIFFAEINRYAEMSPTAVHMPLENLAARAAAFGFGGVTVDGSDVLAVFEATRAAVARARAGDGPTLIEAKTHRWHGHYEGDPQRYVLAADRDEDRRIDPIPRFAEALAARWNVRADEIAAAEREAIDAIADSIAFAEASQGPAAHVMTEDVYA